MNMSPHALFLTLSLIWTLIASCLLLLSWWLAARGGRRGHRGLILFLTLAAWIFVAIYLWQSGQPRPLVAIRDEYILWLAVHGSLGLIALLGATALAGARLWQARHPGSDLYLNRHHRLFGRIFISLWLFTHLGGIVNYFLFI